MIRPDDVELLGAEDQSVVAELEKAIDAKLREKRGDLGVRLWHGEGIVTELGRRYREAGWHVVIHRSDAASQPRWRVLHIRHPRLVPELATGSRPPAITAEFTPEGPKETPAATEG